VTLPNTPARRFVAPFMWEEVEPLPESVPPPEGWHPITCDFTTHKWTLEVEDGKAHIACADPCDPAWFEPGGRTPCCLCDWQPDDFHTPHPIPVTLTYVDDSTPSTPAGPAEYGFYIEVRRA
jgi:hypothetical protein